MFQIVIKDTKEFLRDKSNMFFFFMFPLILIFLLGNLLGSMDQAEEAIGTMTIHYQMDTKDVYQKAAAESFIQTAGEGNGQLNLVKTDDIEKSKELAGKDEITAAVVFTGEPMEIMIYEGTNATKNRAVNAVFNSFIQTDKALLTVMEENPAVLSDLGSLQEDYVVQKDLGIKRSMIDYYAVSMLAMVCFLSMLVGAGAFVGERKSKTINRLIITPQNRILLFFQKILGMTPQVFMQIILIMAVSVIVFKAHYAATLAANLYLFLMFFIMTFCMIALGAFVGIFIKGNPTAVIMPVLWIIMFFGGTYAKEMYIEGISNLMPIYQIQQAAFDLAVFGNYEKASYVIVISIAVMLAALAAGAFLFHRKEEER